MVMMDHVWRNARHYPWDCINRAMSNALHMVIGTGMEITRADFEALDDNYRMRYWIGEDGRERLYAYAVFHDNLKAVRALEEYMEIKPFFANHVEIRVSGISYLHRSDIQRARERLVKGCSVWMDGKRWKIMGFSDDVVRFAWYDMSKTDSSHPEKRLKLNRQQIAEKFPAKK
jgi:hypothetical protein